jgi:hypothetical protein
MSTPRQNQVCALGSSPGMGRARCQQWQWSARAGSCYNVVLSARPKTKSKVMLCKILWQGDILALEESDPVHFKQKAMGAQGRRTRECFVNHPRKNWPEQIKPNFPPLVIMRYESYL